MYTALLHNVINLCMKFEVTSFNTFEVMPRARFHDTNGRTDGRTGRQGDSIIPHPQTLLVGVLERYDVINMDKWGYNYLIEEKTWEKEKLLVMPCLHCQSDQLDQT